MFSLVEIGERAGSGMGIIYEGWADAGLAEPVYEEQFGPDRTVLILPLVAVGDSDNNRQKANESERKRTKANESERKRTKANESERKRTKELKSARAADNRADESVYSTHKGIRNICIRGTWKNAYKRAA